MGLHIGVVCLVQDDQERFLIAKRSDFGTWNFPTGRLDYGETLIEAAERETFEETGIHCRVSRPIGLYYQQGRERMNVAFLAKAVGGSLEPDLIETSECRWSAIDELPPNLFGRYMLEHALAGGLHCHIHHTPEETLRELERKLQERRQRNAAEGRPEPEWAEFRVTARADVAGRVYRAIISPHTPPWEQLAQVIQQQGGPQIALDWLSVDENLVAHQLEFVFIQARPS
ncbi:MAG: NUDIX domain-containing protein [Anaerolineae bacterium]|nr:NUDIX domain-containing protein [Anaerolineae bacterium]MDW8171446.1 NUDIX domain-containing protein [Anaerolineae bacterium]